MAEQRLTLPPPTMFANKPILTRSESLQPLQIHIQVPCLFAKYVVDQWDVIATNALIQLVSQVQQTDTTTDVEYLRVLDIQNEPIFTQKLSSNAGELKWGPLTDLTYELDTFHEGGALDKVYAVTFMTEQNVTQFNLKFDDAIHRHSASSDKLLPFLTPLTDAIERGDVAEAIKRFNFICQFPAEQKRGFKIVSETPPTPEEIKQKNTIIIRISVENYEGLEAEISLSVLKTATIGDLREIMYTTYEIPLEVQKWLGEQCLYKNSETVLDSTSEPKKIYLYILNAAKVGLNRFDFTSKLESQRKNLKAKKEPVIQPQPLPGDEGEVPLHQEHEYNAPLPPELSQPYPPPRSDYPPQILSPVDPNEPEQERQTIPGVIWACPKCPHINPWVCMRCERCRIPREEAL